MNLFFFLFSSITVLSAIAVISSRNPVHSVLFLILAFVNSAGLFVLAGAEFLAMILLDSLCRRCSSFVSFCSYDA